MPEEEFTGFVDPESLDAYWTENNSTLAQEILNFSVTIRSVLLRVGMHKVQCEITESDDPDRISCRRVTAEFTTFPGERRLIFLARSL